MSHPPLSLSLFSLRSSLRPSSTCTWPLRETSVEQAILLAVPHTTLPAPLPHHHAYAPLYSQRKSPFPEAITLGTIRSGLKCDLCTQTGTGSAACVCVAAKSNTYGWAVRRWFLVYRVVGGNHYVFSASSLIERSICFFSTTRLSRLTSLRTVMCFLALHLHCCVKYDNTFPSHSSNELYGCKTALMQLHVHLNEACEPQARDSTSFLK